MMFLWQRLIYDVPRGGDGGSNSDGGYGGGFDAGTAGDIAGFAGASAAGETQAGVSMGDAAAEAAGNIGGTSGGESQAAANAEATQNAMTKAAFADMAAAAAPSAGPSSGMTAAQIAASYDNFSASLAPSVAAAYSGIADARAGMADVASPGAQAVSGQLSGLALGDVFGGSSLAAAASGSVASALGPTNAGAFGLSGPVGIGPSTSAATLGAQGVSPTTDVSTGLSAMGLGDVTMGGFGPGGIEGTGTTADGVSGLGMGGGIIGGGLGELGALGVNDALGNMGPAGFATTDVGYSTSPDSTPRGGQSFGVLSGSQMGPSSKGLGGPAFGMTSAADVFGGAPYSGAEVGFLGASGVPGTRANALAEQQAQMAAQAQQNPTYEVSPTMSKADAALSLRGGLLANLPGIPDVPAELQSSSLAVAAATPVSAAVSPTVSQPSTSLVSQTTAPTVSQTPAQTVSQAPVQTVSQTPISQTPAQTVSQTPAATVSQTPAASPSRAATAAPGPSRAASSFSQETFADPLTGAPVNVSIIDGVETVSLGQTQPQGGIAGLLSNPYVSTGLNTALSIAAPQYGLLNAASLLGTGTSIVGQLASLAGGQGFQTGGGLLGAIGSGGFGQGGSPAGGYGGGGGGGGNNADFATYPSGAPGSTANIPAPQYKPAETQIAEAPLQGVPYNLAAFGPASMPAPQVVATPSPAFYAPLPARPAAPAAAYFTPQGYPINPPAPSFFSDYVTREAYRGDRPAYYT